MTAIVTNETLQQTFDLALEHQRRRSRRGS